jgi:lactate permease
MWIVLNAILLYNVAVTSGSFDAFRDWILEHLPNDRRVVLVVIGFCFGALLEGIAGFGTPVAITSALLISVGFMPLDALVFTLIFNTAPVAFSALGVPITVLAAVTHLPPTVLAAMVGRQLPVFALLLPFYVTTLYASLRSVGTLWPLLLVTGGSFALVQFLCSNLINYGLTDVLAALISLATTLLFLQHWEPTADLRFAVHFPARTRPRTSTMSAWQAWAPWIVVSATVTLWTTFAVFRFGDTKIAWPILHNAVSITLYKGASYPAVWDFQPLCTGSAILIAALVTARLVSLRPAQFLDCAIRTWRQTRFAILTVIFMLALAYVMNYSGLNYTLGLGIPSVGSLFVVLSPFLGWLAVMLSGSDASGNALFGNLQVIAASQLKLDPVLFAATNSSGGVMGKMISLQNIATGCSVTELCADEGAVFARTFPHSIILTGALGAVVAVQQFLVPCVIPH